MGQIRVGFSGWTFAGWRGDFYPNDLVQRRELEYASRQVNSIEINGTFHALQRPESFKNWYDQTPDDFVFAVKAPQFITHIRRLKNCAEPLSNFVASGLLCLGEKLGPILWQFPPNVKLKDDRFEEFVKLLPHDSRAAALLAKKHGPKVRGRAHTQALCKHRVRHAFEFRHPSFANRDFLDMLRAHNIACVVTHAGKNAIEVETPTADFSYLRFLGEEKRYAKGYPKAVVSEWSKRIRGWSRGRNEVFAYFGTDAKEYAPSDALQMMKELKLKPVEGFKKLAA